MQDAEGARRTFAPEVTASLPHSIDGQSLSLRCQSRESRVICHCSVRCRMKHRRKTFRHRQPVDMTKLLSQYAPRICRPYHVRNVNWDSGEFGSATSESTAASSYTDIVQHESDQQDTPPTPHPLPRLHHRLSSGAQQSLESPISHKADRSDQRTGYTLPPVRRSISTIPSSTTGAAVSSMTPGSRSSSGHYRPHHTPATSTSTASSESLEISLREVGPVLISETGHMYRLEW